MDLSKLPKLSDTPAPATPTAQEAAREHVPDDRREDKSHSVGAEVWLSAIIGLVFLLLGRRFAQYIASVMSGKTFSTGVDWVLGPKQGTPVSYPELQGYVMYTEASMFFFGLALLFEAAMLAVIHSPRAKFKRPMIMFALLVAFMATALNLIVSLMLFTTGVLPLFSLLAVAFGGYILMHEWGLFQSFSSQDSRNSLRA